LHPLTDRVEMCGDDAAHHRLEQLFLGLEIEIRQTLAHAGAGGDILDLGRRIAMRGEFLERCGDDLLRARVAPLAPLRAWGLALPQCFLSGHGSAPSMTDAQM